MMKQHHNKVDPEVAARIRAREEQALACGWSRDLLWDTRVWNIGSDGKNRPGLAALLSPKDYIGEITENYIEIINWPGGFKHRYYHPDRQQPWVRFSSG